MAQQITQLSKIFYYFKLILVTQKSYKTRIPECERDISYEM